MQSLSGHTSAVESVSFDSSEVLVAAGAASGTIKLWDLEEAKSKYPGFLCKMYIMITYRRNKKRFVVIVG